MPYIITIKNPTRLAELEAAFAYAGGRGVELADEIDALRSGEPYAVAVPTKINAMCIEHGATGLTTAELRRIVNEGDTIGPLPDGTVIEVERIEWPALAKVAGKQWITYEPSSDHLREAIIDAYNKETV